MILNFIPTAVVFYPPHLFGKSVFRDGSVLPDQTVPLPYDVKVR